MSKGYDKDWAELRMLYRRNVNRVLTNIRNGSVDENDLNKLHNFCMDSLFLMSKVPEAVWRKAEKEAELASLLLEVYEETKDDVRESESSDLAMRKMRPTES